MDTELLTEFFSNGSQVHGNWCYSYNSCHFEYRPCARPHPDVRYTDASAAWVLNASIIVFFMKAGFMLLEIAFARNVEEKRYVVVTKLQDAFASAFGFFILGYDVISRYGTRIGYRFFGVTDPVVWFFKFTFASNAATIIGGCLVTNKYKLRLPAAFISAFVISGVIHPLVAHFIWSDDCRSLSPYRFCSFGEGVDQQSCGYNCTEQMSLLQRLYVLDFAGGGAVHLIGGIAGLMVCLFAKIQEKRFDKKRDTVLVDPVQNDREGMEKDEEQEGESRETGSGPEPEEHSNPERSGSGPEPEEQANPEETRSGPEPEEHLNPEGFWDWMYPENGGEETVSEAALGVIILWFCWFAFNCGSTESVEAGRHYGEWSDVYPFYGIPSVIAVNMIMAGASGGTTAILIAIVAQIRNKADSVNANEIANGVLSSLVAITAGCAFVDYWAACLIGVCAVIFYHLGCFAEYKFGIKDTARVVPVHGVCGLWSILAVAVFLVGEEANCNLHAAFEGLCYCTLRLPHLNYGERIAAQLIGALMMIGIGGFISFVMYGSLYLFKIEYINWIINSRLMGWLLKTSKEDRLDFKGGWLLTHPDEKRTGLITQNQPAVNPPIAPELPSHSSLPNPTRRTRTNRSNLGTVSSNYGTMDSTPLGGRSAINNSDPQTISMPGTQGAQAPPVERHRYQYRSLPPKRFDQRKGTPASDTKLLIPDTEETVYLTAHN